MKKNKTIIVMLLLIVILNIITVEPILVRGETIETAKELEKSLESQYGISITLSKQLSKNESVALTNLTYVKDALYRIPNKLIKGLVKHFEAKGKSTTISLILSSAVNNGTASAVYDFESNTIILYIPSSESCMWPSGTESFAILHEFGHMVEYALYDIYGSNKLKSDFVAFNGEIAYGKEWNGNYDYHLYFVRDYASTSFSEDFAETFMASLDEFYVVNYMHEAYMQKKTAPLVKKSEYIKEIIKTQLKVKITRDQWRIYPQTPSLKYADKLNSEVDGGPSYESETMYQYKISKINFKSLLEDHLIWKETKGQVYVDATFPEAIATVNELFKSYKNSMSSNIKRKDVALILSKLIEKEQLDNTSSNNITISDCEGLDSKYKTAVKKVVNLGLINTSKNKFYPESSCTYEQAYYALLRLYDLTMK